MITHKPYEYILGFILCSFIILCLVGTLAFIFSLFIGHTSIIIVIGLIIWMIFNIQFGRKLYKEWKHR